MSGAWDTAAKKLAARIEENVKNSRDKSGGEVSLSGRQLTKAERQKLTKKKGK